MAEAELVVTTGSGGGGGSGGEDEAVQGTRKLQEKIRAHESYAEKVKGAYNDLSKMYNQLRDDYAVFVTKHNEVTKSLETTRAEQDEKIAELEESLAEVKKVQAETEETLQKEIAQREGKIEEVNLELERDSEEIEKLRTELEGIQKTKQDLEEEKIDRVSSSKDGVSPFTRHPVTAFNTLFVLSPCITIHLGGSTSHCEGRAAECLARSDEVCVWHRR